MDKLSKIEIDVLLAERMDIETFDYQTLDEAIESLVRIKELYSSKVLVMKSQYYNYSDEKYWAFYERRLETDEEFAARIEKIRVHEDAIRAREQAEFERLSKKYGDSK